MHGKTAQNNKAPDCASASHRVAGVLGVNGGLLVRPTNVGAWMCGGQPLAPGIVGPALCVLTEAAAAGQCYVH